MGDRSKIRFFSVYWSLFGVAMLLYFYMQEKDVYRESEKHRAVVIDRLEGQGAGRYGNRSSRYYYPQFQFLYHDSLYTSADKIIWIRGKRPGDSLTVIFPRGEPETAKAYVILSYWICLPDLLIAFVLFVFIYAMAHFFLWPVPE